MKKCLFKLSIYYFLNIYLTSTICYELNVSQIKYQLYFLKAHEINVEE